VGLEVSDAAAFGQLVEELAKSSTRTQGPSGTRLFWQDNSLGAGLAMFLHEEGTGITCAKPTFASQSLLSVRPASLLNDPAGCPFCAVATVEVLENGEMVYPLAVELDDLHLGPLSSSTGLVNLNITAFGEALEVSPSVDSYNAADGTEGVKFAAQSLIPSGLFAPGGGERPARAEAIITGIITAAERRVNSHTGASFDWCQVDTLAATMDVVVSPRPEPLQPGQVIQGTFWLVAHRPVDDVAPAAKRRRLARRHRP
jgi:hypothetical protein